MKPHLRRGFPSLYDEDVASQLIARQLIRAHGLSPRTLRQRYLSQWPASVDASESGGNVIPWERLPPGAIATGVHAAVDKYVRDVAQAEADYAAGRIRPQASSNPKSSHLQAGHRDPSHPSSPVTLPATEEEALYFARKKALAPRPFAIARQVFEPEQGRYQSGRL